MVHQSRVYTWLPLDPEALLAGYCPFGSKPSFCPERRYSQWGSRAHGQTTCPPCPPACRSIYQSSFGDSTVLDPCHWESTNYLRENIEHFHFSIFYRTILNSVTLLTYIFTFLLSREPVHVAATAAIGEWMTPFPLLDKMMKGTYILLKVLGKAILCRVVKLMICLCCPPKICYEWILNLLREGPASQPQSTLFRWKNLPPLSTNSDPPP